MKVPFNNISKKKDFISMKLIVCDVEGTIFQAKYKIAGTDFASTMWQPLAHCLGPSAILEERNTHKKWDNNEYKNYIDWVKSTFEIHKKYNLSRSKFNNLIKYAEYNIGVEYFFDKIDRKYYIPALISGGFEELILRAQKELKINHGTGACKYFFDDVTGMLVNCSLNPSDFEGKYDYVLMLLKIYDLDPNTDWVFIGDGKNDVDVATRAPLSFGINAHAELAKVVTYNVSDFHEIYEIINRCEDIIHLGPESLISDDSIDINDIENKEILRINAEKELAENEIALKNAECELLATALDALENQLIKVKTSLASEKSKRKLAEISNKELNSKLQQLDKEIKDTTKIYNKKMKEINNTSENYNSIKNSEIEELNEKVNFLTQEKENILTELTGNKYIISRLSVSIIDKDNTISVLKMREEKLIKENDEPVKYIKINRNIESKNTDNIFETLVFKTLSDIKDNNNENWELIKEFDANPDGKRSMFLDGLVISRNAIYVIEAKKYSGEIKSLGDVKNNKWLCCKRNGTQVPILSSPTNPYHQIQKYCSGVRTLYDKRTKKKIKVYGIIVFPDDSDVSEIGVEIGDFYRVGTVKNIADIIRKIEYDLTWINVSSSNSTPDITKKILLGIP